MRNANWIASQRIGPRSGARHAGAAGEITRARGVAVRHRTLDRRRRRVFGLLALCVGGLIPWTIRLALTLPSEHSEHGWRVTWVGFDALLLVAMGATALLGWRRRGAAQAAAFATAVLLICDAWFDVSLDFGTSDVWLSGGLAAFAELPLAGFLIHWAHSASRQDLTPSGSADARSAYLGPGSAVDAGQASPCGG